MGRGRKSRGRPLHGVLLVDKPAGASSNRVLQHVRRALDARKAGHAGTLDPLATGMLPVLLGEATKLAGYLLDADKAYETTLKLGVETDSLDADGSIVRQRPVPAGLDRARIEAIVAGFRGDQLQTPPMVSAIRVDGQRLYKLARQGREVERRARAITVHAIDVLEVGADTVRLAVRCSKGTYIRVLGADMGERLDCGAHVQALRRTWVAPFEHAAMHSPAAVEREGQALLLPMDAGLHHLPIARVDADGLRALRQGQHAPAVGLDRIADVPPSPSAAGTAEDTALPAVWRVYGPPCSAAAEAAGGSLVALGALEPGGVHGIVRPVRVLQLTPDG